MGCGTCCLKCFLIFTNVILGIIGLILLALGIFMKVAANKYINQYAGSIVQGISNLSGSNSTQSGQQPQLDFSPVLDPVSTALIVFGAFVAVLSFIGAFGACCDSKCLLGLYLTVLVALIVAELIIVILFFTQSFDSQIHAYVLSTIVNDYVDIDDYGVYSLAWNYVMFDFKCCGVESYQDFGPAKLWHRTRNQTVGSVVVTYNLTTPLSCCKLQGQFPAVTLVDNMCAVTPTVSNSNFQTGCWGQVTTFLTNYRLYVIIAVTVILVFEALIVAVALGICYNIGKQKVSPEYY